MASTMLAIRDIPVLIPAIFSQCLSHINSSRHLFSSFLWVIRLLKLFCLLNGVLPWPNSLSRFRLSITLSLKFPVCQPQNPAGLWWPPAPWGAAARRRVWLGAATTTRGGTWGDRWMWHQPPASSAASSDTEEHDPVLNRFNYFPVDWSTIRRIWLTNRRENNPLMFCVISFDFNK